MKYDTVVDLLYIVKNSSLKQGRWSLFICYLRLAFNYHLGLKSKDKEGYEHCLGYKIRFANYKTFFKLFRDIFVRNTYYFYTQKIEPTIIDAGANIGMVTLYYKVLYPKAKILAFEPSPETFEILKDNVENNNLNDITIFNTAISDNNSSTMEFFHHGSVQGNTGSSVIKDIVLSKSKKIGRIQVKNSKLSRYITQPVDMLKLDIEGMESEVIHDLITSNKVDLVLESILEFHYNKKYDHNKLHSLLTELSSCGFDYFIYRVEHDPSSYWFKNKNHYHFMVLAYRTRKKE